MQRPRWLSGALSFEGACMPCVLSKVGRSDIANCFNYLGIKTPAEAFALAS